MPALYIIIFALIILSVVLAIELKRQRLNKKLKSSAFNPAWVLILQKNMALYNKLPDPLRIKLHGLVNVFLHEKTFSGYNGLQITDEIKVTIAAQACLLMLNRDEDLYPSLYNIYVYPGAFKSMQANSNGVIHSVEESVRIGESWQRGHVVLSWQHSKEGGINNDDGHNVVYHEFAHQLDHGDGAIDGTPVLDSVEDYAAWAQVFGEEYTRLRDQIRANKTSLIDGYGAVSEGEFFAVVTELFFEKPRLFNKEHPELYKQLINFYHLNPLAWI